MADFPKVTNNRFDLIRSQFFLARILRNRKTYDAAILAFQQGLNVGKQLISIPKVDYFRLRIAEAHTELGELLRIKRRTDEAAVEYEQALALYKSLSADYPKNDIYRNAVLVTQQFLNRLRAN